MSPAVPRPLPDFADLVLGRDPEIFEVDGFGECRDATLSLARQFERTMVIVTRSLDPRLYDDASFVDHVRSTVVANRRARVRILIRDPGPAVRSGHRLIDLATRLSTFIEMRVLAPQHSEFNRASLVVDGVGSVNRPLSDRFEATVCFGSRAVASELLREFEEMWAVGRADPGLRRLHV